MSEQAWLHPLVWLICPLCRGWGTGDADRVCGMCAGTGKQLVDAERLILEHAP